MHKYKSYTVKYTNLKCIALWGFMNVNSYGIYTQINIETSPALHKVFLVSTPHTRPPGTWPLSPWVHSACWLWFKWYDTGCTFLCLHPSARHSERITHRASCRRSTLILTVVYIAPYEYWNYINKLQFIWPFSHWYTFRLLPVIGYFK